jgi:hypothetical protein
MSWLVVTDVKHGLASDSYHRVESYPLELCPIKLKNSSFAGFHKESRINGLLAENYRSHMLFTGDHCAPIVDISHFPSRKTNISVMRPDGSCFGSISFGTLIHYLHTSDMALRGNGWIYIGLDDNHFIMKSSSFDLINSSPMAYLFRYTDSHLCLLSVEIWWPYQSPKLPKWVVDETYMNDTGLRSDWRQSGLLMNISDMNKKGVCLLREDHMPIFVWDKSLCSTTIIVRRPSGLEYKYVLDKKLDMGANGWVLRNLCNCADKQCHKFCRFELCHYDTGRRNITKFLLQPCANGDSELLSIELFE